jgi:hypothetical protein
MTARKADIAALPFWPRLLSAEQAAQYCGVSRTHFTAHCPVASTRIGDRKLYDIKALDEWVDKLSGKRKITMDDVLKGLDDHSGEGRKAG